MCDARSGYSASGKPKMAGRHFNQLILMTDEHSRKVLGCYGNKLVKTPNIDKLAREGTLFTDAYTNAPICVPAGHHLQPAIMPPIASLDNATPYFGTPSSWGASLQKAGITVGSIGKLHYRNAEDDVGWIFRKFHACGEWHWRCFGLCQRAFTKAVESPVDG